MGRPERRRRTPVAMVMVLATWALVATSPPMEPIQVLEDTERIPLRLASDAPVSVVRFSIAASDEALWSDDVEVIPQGATVSLQAYVPRPQTSSPAQSVETGPTPVLGVRVMLDGRAMGSPEPDDTYPSQAEFDLREACPESRDCDLEFEAIVEWLNPHGVEPLSAELVITASASVQGPEVAPVGAEISLTANDADAPDVAVLRDAKSATSVRLDADQPMVMWSVDLEANRSAMAEPLQWPIDPRGVLSLHVDTPHAGASPYVRLRLLLIGAGEDVELRPSDVGTLQHQLPVFRCPVVGEPCEERVTLVALWEGSSPEEAVTIGWDLDVGITYHDPAEPADGAAVSVSEPMRTDIDRHGPSISASVAGSIPLVDEENRVRVRTVHIGIPGAALEQDLVGGPVPAVLAVVTASSTSTRPVDDETQIRFGAGEANLEVPPPFEPAVSRIAWPIPLCRAGPGCTTDLGLSGSAYRPGGGLEGTELTVEWRVEVFVLYPDGTSPPDDAEITLTVGQP